MTTKLKERIVALSRNERVEKNFIIYCWIGLAFLIFSYFFNALRTIAFIMAVIAILGSFHYYAFKAIKKQTDEVINNNKLIYIILSDTEAVAHYMVPVLSVISVFVDFNLITGVLYIVVSLVIIFKLSKTISNYFKNNKLSKNWWEKAVRRFFISSDCAFHIYNNFIQIISK